MESKSRITSISRNWLNNKLQVTFELESDVTEAVQELTEKDIRLKAVRWTNKRSLSANAYFFVLVGKIASATRQSVTETHNQLIADYGFPEILDNSLFTVILRDDVEWRKLDTIHLHPTAGTRVLDDGKLYRVYYAMRGSHTYDTAEMARLIEGTVSEAKLLGIETLTPDELERMVSTWQGSGTAS